jgi:hypothetical protein
MSLWYSCTFAAIGTDAEVEKLNAGCGSYWHHARVEKRLSPGFIQIQASRNFGAHDATEKMVADFPDLMFVGSLYRTKILEMTISIRTVMSTTASGGVFMR